MVKTDLRIYLDSNILIYAIETDGEKGTLARRWLIQVDRGRIPAATSELTIVEVLPHPLSKGNSTLVQGYKRFLQNRPTLQVVPVTSPILFHAAKLRVEFNSETPDAIHVATTLASGCVGFLTEDGCLKLPSGLRRYTLSDIKDLYP